MRPSPTARSYGPSRCGATPWCSTRTTRQGTGVSEYTHLIDFGSTTNHTLVVCEVEAQCSYDALEIAWGPP
jgi:hypothetical protein